MSGTWHGTMRVRAFATSALCTLLLTQTQLGAQTPTHDIPPPRQTQRPPLHGTQWMAVTGKPLFRCLAEWILASRGKFGATAPWYIMTSPANHEQTEEFFRDQNWFGLSPDGVMLFQQGVLPSFDMATGRVLLAAKDEPAPPAKSPPALSTMLIRTPPETCGG